MDRAEVTFDIDSEGNLSVSVKNAGVGDLEQLEALLGRSLGKPKTASVIAEEHLHGTVHVHAGATHG